MKEKGFTIVPVEVYFKGSLVKVEIALAKGKKLYDKRADIAKKDQKREAQRDFKIIEYGLVKVSTGPTRSGGPWFWADRSGAENMERSCMYPAKKMNMG